MSIENGKLGLTAAEGFTLDWKKNAKKFMAELPDDKIPRAFTIRRAELEFLLLQMTILECDATRMYLGLKPSESPHIDIVQDPCLIMTGVRDFRPDFNDPGNSKPGKEVYFSAFPANINPAIPSEEPYVLDFAYPCPDTCQIDSPLMNPASPAAGRTY
jgi:hypothetical protein